MTFECEREVPIFKAAYIGDLEAVRKYLESNVDVDIQAKQDGTTIAMLAVQNNNIKLLELLEEFGADFSLWRYEGKSCLDDAILSGNSEIIEWLLKRVCCANTDVLKPGILVSAIKNGVEGKVIKFLLDNLKVNVNEMDESGQTALMAAVQLGEFKIVGWLLSKNFIDVNYVNLSDGYSALDYACLMGHENITVLLVVAGAKSGYKLLSKPDADFLENTKYKFNKLIEMANNKFKNFIELMENTDTKDKKSFIKLKEIAYSKSKKLKEMVQPETKPSQVGKSQFVAKKQSQIEQPQIEQSQIEQSSGANEKPKRDKSFARRYRIDPRL